MSWYFIFLKLFTIHRAQSRTEQFERDFWSGSDLPALFQSAGEPPAFDREPRAHFRGRVREFQKLKGQRGVADPSLMVDGASVQCERRISARWTASKPASPSSPRWAR